ncbi:hypothetical protein BCR32DRAFT_324027 [Anaeromyces robustus]|jgi:hypothetical protein|uniref:Uncharacterized protein n=1 Tax=Anaeromyces robustus TaxID=1754192 RepID=A0A1Y1XSB3_9FUNG|nr:hypothetical protein BCR32DRAFT_324027 [Anaeromyces robustus]|eukprot:ORX88204.1 hypothetical protein BCR32DRAFT_324027 [Anaeromyces robustus]
MNFKSILGFAAVALFGMTNAIPVSSHFDFIKEKCEAMNGIPLLEENGTLTYACLIKYSDNEANSSVSDKNFCIKHDGSVLCISRENTNVMFCDKEYRFANERDCLGKILELSVASGFKLNRPIITFPENKRYVLTPREDGTDCKAKGGIVVRDGSSIYNYICFVPEGKEEGETHCGNINGKRYCVEENLSSNTICNKKEYQAQKCLEYLVEYAVANNARVSNFQ